MKKYFYLLVMLILPFNGWAQNMNVATKRLKSISRVKGNSSALDKFEFSYDNLGRVIQFVETSDNGNIKNVNFSYNEDHVEVAIQGKRHTNTLDFSIENGKVTSGLFNFVSEGAIEFYNYEYDSSGKMIKKKKMSEDEASTGSGWCLYELEWSGDNLSNCLASYYNKQKNEVKKEWECSFQYNNISTDPILHLLFGFIDLQGFSGFWTKDYVLAELLAIFPYMGTLPKNLFYRIDNIDYLDRNRRGTNEYTYETNAQGDIVRISVYITDDYSNSQYTDVYTLEWEGASSEVSGDIDITDNGGINFGTDIDGGTNLDGNAVGNIYYNISPGDGGYNAAEGCIVVTTPTDDSAIDGQDIFGEDFKDNYTGIVFKVPAGKGTIKVEAQTTGGMMLKVKVGNNDPIEMALQGKLKVTIPYDVPVPTYVYIYAGSLSAGARGNRAGSDGELKIYGIEVSNDASGISAAQMDNESLPRDNYYTLDGRKVDGIPARKGVYIVNGRKVVVK